MNNSKDGMDKKVCQLPNWLWPNSNSLPQVYRRIWEVVKEDRLGLGAAQGKFLVDTNKVFPLLLTSQLPTEVLGYIWSLANQNYAGQLTEQELYVVLALIAVAQTSYSFSSLDVLHMLPGPPTPRLNLSVLHSAGIPSPSIFPEITKLGLEPVPERRRAEACRKIDLVGIDSLTGEIDLTTSNNAIIDCKSTSRQVHPPARSVAHEKEPQKPQSNLQIDFTDDFTEFQSASVVQPNLPKLDLKLGSTIGSRLANHNLSGPKKLPEKSRKPVSKNPSNTSLKSSSSSDNFNKDGGLMKNDFVNFERLGGVFPKCMIKNEEKTVILKDTAIRSEPLESKKGELLKETGKERKNSRDPEGLGLDLMNMQPVEDKYSALRILVDVPKIQEEKHKVSFDETTEIFDDFENKNDFSSKLEDSTETFDDFGDFVSAEGVEINLDSGPSMLDTSMDLFSDFEQFLPSSGNDKSEISFVQETIEAFAQLEMNSSPEKTLDYLEEKYEATIDPEKIIQKEDTISINSIELGNPEKVLTRSGSVPSLDLKSFLSANVDDDKETENMHQMIYWEWKQYMESCVLLLQVAANIFTSISSDIVLQEVLNSAQGYNFLCNLAEVAAVCRRVNFSHKEMDINIMGFDDLLMDIDKIWAEMEPFYVNIPIVTELPVWPLRQGESTSCALCLTVVSRDRVVFNEANYHATCANLWIHCVSNNLPALRYIPSHPQAIIAGGSQI